MSSKRACASWKHSIPARMCPGRRTGAAIGSYRKRSSSGKDNPTACTTGCATNDSGTAAGGFSGWLHESTGEDAMLEEPEEVDGANEVETESVAPPEERETRGLLWIFVPTIVGLGLG